MTETLRVDKKTPFKVEIRSKDGVLYSGNALYLSSTNESGPFDILPQHANFITLIHGYIFIDSKLPTEKKFELDRGVLYVLSNNVNVYVGI